MCKEGVISVFIGYNRCMTQISRDDVLHLAQLSSLQLSDTEIDDLQKDIGNILGYVQQLSELDTRGIEPTYQVTDLENVWRDDVVIDDHVTREQLLDLSTESLNHQVKVPKVL
jgi:aspartyl-tRNA(Asn)/glutamyl-tRNA(Gln) amidotransferase subunit C